IDYALHSSDLLGLRIARCFFHIHHKGRPANWQSGVTTYCLDHRRPDSGQDREFYKKDFVFLFILTTKALFLVKIASFTKEILYFSSS
ncbi:MAG: hypothetical protein QM296_06950, partial [Bacillota bacterium]|nr:hypothetical protein [Bacillota bacterium]